MNKPNRLFRCQILAAALAITSINTARATDLYVTVNTASIVGDSGTLYFDFVSGGSDIANTSTISAFSTDGRLGSITALGSETGALPGTVSLSSTSFYNELAQQFTYGSQFSFDLKLTENGPGTGNPAEGFSLFLGDDAYGKTVPTTSDPNGGNALFLFNIDGSSSGKLSTYASSDLPITWKVTSATTTVPIPSAIWLLASGVMGMGLATKRHRRI